MLKVEIALSYEEAACLYKEEWDGTRHTTLRDAVLGHARVAAAAYRRTYSMPDVSNTMREARAKGFLPPEEPMNHCEPQPDPVPALVTSLRELCELAPSTLREDILRLGDAIDRAQKLIATIAKAEGRTL